MKDLKEFSEWMEKGLTEAVIEAGAEKCLMAFVLPNGEILLGDWNLTREDVEAVSNELVISIRDMLVLEAMNEMKAEQDEECGWFEE